MQYLNQGKLLTRKTSNEIKHLVEIPIFKLPHHQRVIASAAATSLVLGLSGTKVMMSTMFVQCLPLFLHTRNIPNYLSYM